MPELKIYWRKYMIIHSLGNNRLTNNNRLTTKQLFFSLEKKKKFSSGKFFNLYIKKFKTSKWKWYYLYFQELAIENWEDWYRWNNIGGDLCTCTSPSRAMISIPVLCYTTCVLHHYIFLELLFVIISKWFTSISISVFLLKCLLFNF